MVSKNPDLVYFCNLISVMATAPNSLTSGLNHAVNHAGFLQHQSGQGFQLGFLISKNLDGSTADGNAPGTVNCDPAQNMESAKSDDPIPKEIAVKVSLCL